MSKSEGLTMNKKQKKSKMSLMLVALLFTATTSMTMASDISGVTGVNGVFNISPSKYIGNMGFREYQNFNLTKGDTANLRTTNTEKFVNMVDNQININGLVRTVDNSNNLSNGHAVFMSPKGMIVGSDGVFNVGSLSVYTPTASGMKMLKDGVASGNLVVQDGKYKGVDLMEAMGWHGNAPITINGKIVAANDVTMVANKFNLSNTGTVLAGANLTDSTLFNQLVNTGTNNTAKIEVRTYNRGTGDSGYSQQGLLRNLGRGNIEITNRGASGLVQSGTVEAKNGQLHLVNATGNSNISGNVIGNGDNVHLTNGADAGKMTISGNINSNAGARIWNKSASGLELTNSANITNQGKGLAITNEAGALNLKGNINLTNSDMNITNKGSGLVLNNVNATGSKLVISNEGANGMQLNGTIANNKSTAITNYNGTMTVNGTVKSTAGKMNLTNKGNGGLYLSQNSKIEGAGEEVLIQNTGAGGFTSKGEITSSAKTYLQNTNGDMKIDSDVTNRNNLLYVGNVGNGGLTVNGKLSNQNGKIRVYNKGTKGLTVNADIENKNSGTALTNRAGNFALNANVTNQKGNINLTNVGNGSLTIASDKTVSTTEGEIVVQNTGSNGMNINGVVDNNKGNVIVYNKAGNLNVASTGKIVSESGNVYVSNAGNALNTQKGSEIITKGSKTKLNMLNTGNGGMNLNGTTRSHSGTTKITNRAGNLNLNGLVENSGGRVYVNNSGNGALKLTNNGGISNVGLDRTYITNKGTGGMQIDGTVAGGGHVIATNRAGGMNITSKVTSTKSNVVLTNTGNKDMNISGTVRGKKVTAKSVGNDIVLGNKETNQISINGLKKVFITTENGSIKNAGVDTHVIKSGGNLYMHANNGSIGQDVDTTGVGKNSRDLTKSINVVVDGNVKAFTTDKKNNSVINIATKGHDLKVDRIKADGKVILLTDKYTDENGEEHTGSILNSASELKKYANVKGTSIHMISSGSIGTNSKPLHFRQTDATQKSNVVAVKNINLHARGKQSGEDVNFGVIKSKEGSIKADLIKDANIDNAIAAKKIDISSRRFNADLKIKKSSHNTDIIKDYFD